MKSSLKLSTVFLFLSIGVFAAASSFRAAPRAATADAEASNASVREIYANNCARCHGTDGKSQTELGKLYDSPDLTQRSIKRKGTKTLARSITNGKGSMPAFGKKIPAKDIAALVRYVRSL